MPVSSPRAALLAAAVAAALSLAPASQALAAGAPVAAPEPVTMTTDGLEATPIVQAATTSRTSRAATVHRNSGARRHSKLSTARSGGVRGPLAP